MLDTQKRDITPKDALAIGKAMYREEILPRLTDADRGMFLVLDISTGDYEMDASAVDARIRLARRRPDAVMHLELVGEPAPVRAVSIRGTRFVGDD